jgi:ABC-2 type transport system ATP-binding protein
MTLEIEQGELFGLLGPNGAGKTTLISILSTMLPATSGGATVCGHEVRREEDAVRQCIGIVFQDPSLDDDLTGEENLDFHGRLYGMDSRTRGSRMAEVLRLVDLEDRRDDLVKTYSGGMRRRLEIARGLMHRPRVLFLDEPTIGLDPQTRMRMWEYIKGVNNEGTTIFLTTHYMDEADQLSDRISIIDQGKIIISGKPWELKNTLGRDLIYMETNNNEAALRLLKDLPRFRDIKTKTKGFVLMVNEDGTKVLPIVIDTLRNAGIETLTINLKKPSMDDVFVFYTGKEFRDEPASKTPLLTMRPGGR